MRPWPALVPVLLALFCTATGPLAAAPARLESEHFVVQYDPERLAEETARGAMAAAERGWEHCRGVFGRVPSGRINCDLTPRFYGATGFAMPSGRPLRIGVRYADLDYLGLSGPYVLAHEIAHIFSGQDAQGPMGEGLADCVAGSFHEMPLAPWWGRALRERRLWTDPDGLFITGDYPASNELDARVRVSQYTEPALLLQFLAKRFGFERMEAFLPAYAKARHSLASNEGSSERPAGPPSTPRRRPRSPDAERVRAVFRDHLGASWDAIRDAWLGEIDTAVPPAGLGERLVLWQETYAAIRAYEAWALGARFSFGEPRAVVIRDTFTRVNRALRSGDTAAASAELRAARALIEGLRRPIITVDRRFSHLFAADACLIMNGLRAATRSEAVEGENS